MRKAVSSVKPRYHPPYIVRLCHHTEDNRSSIVAMMIKGIPAKTIIAVPPMIKAHERRTKGRNEAMAVLLVLRFMGFLTEGASCHSGALLNVSGPRWFPFQKPNPRHRYPEHGSLPYDMPSDRNSHRCRIPGSGDDGLGSTSSGLAGISTFVAAVRSAEPEVRSARPRWP